MWSTKARLRRPIGVAVSAAACALALAACKTGPMGSGKAEIEHPLTPTQQYTVKVVDEPERLALSVHASGLSEKQQAAILDFAQKWHESGAEAITIESPTNSVEEGDPRAAASAMAHALSRMGVPDDRVRLADYDAEGKPGAPLVARYTRLQAVGPKCEGHWGNLVATNANDVTSHFGCATTANFAAMLADPRDLARPAAMQPADGVRRGVILDKYRQGQVTSSAKDDQATGAISSAVK